MSPTPYYNPPEDVLEGRVGRKLQDTGVIPRPFEHYFTQLFDGEVMYVGLTGLAQPKQLVAYAHTEKWYGDFYGRYMSGMYEHFDVYALPAEVVEEA